VAQADNACEGSVMRDIDIINKATDDAQAVLRDYIQLDRATRWTPSHTCSRFWTIKMSSPHRSVCGRAMGDRRWSSSTSPVIADLKSS
jgi:hypothetical protein